MIFHVYFKDQVTLEASTKPFSFQLFAVSTSVKMFLSVVIEVEFPVLVSAIVPVATDKQKNSHIPSVLYVRPLFKTERHFVTIFQLLSNFFL